MDSIADYTRSGESAGDHLGWSVSDAGDINNDGNNDTIAGAPQYNTNASETPPSAQDTGKVYVHSSEISPAGPTIPEFQAIVIPVVSISILIFVKKYQKKRRKGKKNA
jgi:hypothetical protein